MLPDPAGRINTGLAGNSVYVTFMLPALHKGMEKRPQPLVRVDLRIFLEKIEKCYLISENTVILLFVWNNSSITHGFAEKHLDSSENKQTIVKYV